MWMECNPSNDKSRLFPTWMRKHSKNHNSLNRQKACSKDRISAKKNNKNARKRTGQWYTVCGSFLIQQINRWFPFFYIRIKYKKPWTLWFQILQVCGNVNEFYSACVQVIRIEQTVWNNSWVQPRPQTFNSISSSYVTQLLQELNRQDTAC